MSSAYLRLLIFLLGILIPACASSIPAILIRYCAQKVNRQGTNTQPWHIPFPIWNQSVFPCLVLTNHRFLKRQVRWSGIPMSFRIFHSLLWSAQSKALSLSCFYYFLWAVGQGEPSPQKHAFPTPCASVGIPSPPSCYPRSAFRPCPVFHEQPCKTWWDPGVTPPRAMKPCTSPEITTVNQRWQTCSSWP